MKKQKVTLFCEVCLNRNYTIFKSESKSEKIKLKKYCSYCNQHTNHIETR